MTVREALAQLLLVYSQQKTTPWSDDDIALVEECRRALEQSEGELPEESSEGG